MIYYFCKILFKMHFLALKTVSTRWRHAVQVVKECNRQSFPTKFERLDPLNVGKNVSALEISLTETVSLASQKRW